MADASVVRLKRRRKVVDLIGQRFGRLIVLKRDLSRDGGPTRWFCRCDCGTEKGVSARGLLRGRTRSCGCLRAEQTGKRFSRYNEDEASASSYSAEYQTWYAMIKRCYNKNCKSYKYYGDRGISVCDRWRFGENGKSGFEVFFHDMGNRQDPELSIDRIDNDGNYETLNCRWATRIEQANNKRRSTGRTGKYRLVSHGGITRTISEWGEFLGLNINTLISRFQRGLSNEEALKR